MMKNKSRYLKEAQLIIIIALFCCHTCHGFNLATRNIGNRYSVSTIRTFLSINEETQIDHPSSTFPLENINSVQVGGRIIVDHVKMIDASLRKLTGKGVTERMDVESSETISSIPPNVLVDTVKKSICLNKRWVLISHGTEEDPIYNFTNVAGLIAFNRSWDEVRKLPSRESVVFQSKDAKLRIELMEKVTKNGYVEGASGIRTRGGGSYIRLVDAVVRESTKLFPSFSRIFNNKMFSFPFKRYGMSMTTMAIIRAKQLCLIEKVAQFWHL